MSSIDPYKMPGSNVLQNKPGIANENALRTFEYEASAIRALELRENPVQGKFDLKHLQEIHKHLFKDVYDWAGEIRTVNLSKGGTSFERNSKIQASAEIISERLRSDNLLQGLNKSEFVEKLSHYYSDINALHPFREGNGRSTREFISQLSNQAGYDFDQTRIDNDKSQFYDAAKKGMHGDLSDIKKIFTEAVRPTRAVAFEILTKQDALKRHPQLQANYDALDKRRAYLQEQYPTNKKAVDHYMGHAITEQQRILDTGSANKAENKSQQKMPASSQDFANAISTKINHAKAEAFLNSNALEAIQRYPELKTAFELKHQADTWIKQSFNDTNRQAIESARIQSGIANKIREGQDILPSRTNESKSASYKQAQDPDLDLIR